MCYICKLRLAKLLEKGYIFDAQVAEVTEEIFTEFEKLYEKASRKLEPVLASALNEVLLEGTTPLAQDFVNIMKDKIKTGQGITDDILDKIIKNYDPRKVN